MYIVIRAGGVGSRLWPVSREKNPKQFHALTSDKTLLEEAIQRVASVAPLQNIFVSTNSDAEQLVRTQHHEIPGNNIIVEPLRKDTAAAIGLESIIIRQRDPRAVVASLGSDHSVARVPEFQRILRVAEAAAQKYPDYIIPIGVHPTHPDTGYGYIQCDGTLDTIDGTTLWNVTHFTEKPDLKRAKEFVAQANYLWNANMFVWRVDTILALYERYLPEMYQQLLVIEQALGTPAERDTIARVYPELQQVAVDYAIIEKASKIAAISADIGWSDIGDWARLKDELAPLEEENVVIGAEHVALDTTNSLVYSTHKGKVIATIGVENLVIVETDDALLVCDKYHSHAVKEIVEQLKQHKHSDVL